MSGSFLTLEDINGILLKYGDKGLIYSLNTSNITLSDVDYTDIQYDFVKVSRSKSGSTYTFTFEVVNSSWNGEYTQFKLDGSYLNTFVSYTNDKITFSTSEQNVILWLYCNHINTTFNFKEIECYPINFDLNVSATLEDITEYIMYVPSKLISGNDMNTSYYQKQGVFTWDYLNTTFYYLGRLLKTDFVFDCNQSLTVSGINKVQLGADTKYKPNGSLIGDNTVTIKVEYNKQIIPVEWDSTLNDYTFNLDLTHITEPGKIKFKVIIESNDVINHTEKTVTLESDYQTINDFNSFKKACSDNGYGIIRIGDDLLATSNIQITHPIKIIGNNHTLDLDEHSIILNEETSLNVENMGFYNGDTAIIQAKNTRLELTSCSFTNCKSTKHNNLGSCIYCNIDIPSLEEDYDYITIIEYCRFTDNQSAILHRGTLTITGTEFHNSDIGYTDKDNPAFLYQTDGTANITGSVFDIDYTDDTYCTNQENIRYAQTVLMIGENAIINSQNHEQLQQNNTLNFFDASYNNRSHIYCKYYYPSIETCVYTSPLPNREDKAICYSCSGIDYIFKSNVQVTRASWETQNEERKITW